MQRISQEKTLSLLAKMKLKAQATIPEADWDFIEGGAGDESTIDSNTQVFKQVKIKPRVLRGLNAENISIAAVHPLLAGKSPILISPLGYMKLSHPEGEIITAKAVAKSGNIMIVSCLAGFTLEEIRRASPDATLWFNLYIHSQKEEAEQLIKRAEEENYEKLVITLDVPIRGDRRREDWHAYQWPERVTPVNFSPPVASALDQTKIKNFESVDWNHLNWIRGLTKMPIILKGILHPDDAILAIDNGFEGIIVSNHGGRQLAGTVSTLEALPPIVKAVNKRCLVLLDSGIDGENSVFTALAHGADGVCGGRPFMYALVEGEKSINALLDDLHTKLKHTMILTGHRSIADINASAVVSPFIQSTSVITHSIFKEEKPTDQNPLPEINNRCKL